MWIKYRDKIYFVLFILQVTLIYKLIQHYFLTGSIFKTALDDKIPFLAIFVIPYFLYIFVLVAVFALAFKNKQHFGALSKSFFFASLICNLLFIVFPVIMIRPEILPTNFLNRLVLFVYSIDAPINCFPSEHVAFSVLANLCLSQVNRRFSIIFLPLTIAIVFSTLLIKQHYMLDVLAGLILAWVIYVYIFKMRILAESSAVEFSKK